MNRNLITFSANEQTLIKTGGINNYASNTVSYIVAEFDLGENWDEFDSVRAIFQSDFETAPAVLAHGYCVIPFEVLRYRSTVRVNLVGSVAENDVLVDRLTTFPITALNVTADALVDNSIAPISPSEFEQFVAMVKDDADRAEAGAESAESSASAASTSAQSAEDSALSASNSASDASASAQTAQEEAQKITGMVVVVTQLPEGATPTSDWSDGVLTIGIPKGDTGETGATGNGIDSAVLNANYTLTLTFTDGTSYTTPSIRGATGATGATGNGISSVTLTSTSGAVKTYTIAFTDGTNTTFDVTDGEVTQAVLDEEITALKSDKLNKYTTVNCSIPSRRINASGVATSDSTCKCSDYIPCEEGIALEYYGTSFIYQGDAILSMISFYNEDKTFISSITKIGEETANATGIIKTTAPANTAYVRGSIRTNFADSANYYLHVYDREEIIDTLADLPSIVSDEQARTDYLNANVFEAVERIPVPNSNYASSWKLDGTGKSVSASGYALLKYEVTEGSAIWVKASADTEGVYQFQSEKSVPASLQNDGLIGKPCNIATDGIVIVPKGATWIIISKASSNAESGLYTYRTKYSNIDFLTENLGMYENVFQITAGSAHSSTKDRISVNIKQGEEFSVYSSADTAEIFNTQWWGLRADGGGDVRIATLTINNGGRFVASNDFNAIGVYIGSQSEDHTITMIVKTNIACATDDCVSDSAVLRNTFNSAYTTASLDDKVKEFSELFIGSEEVEPFLFFTDPHFYIGGGFFSDGSRANFEKYMPVIQKAYNSTPVSFCLCGGDWLTNSDTPAEACAKLGYMDAVTRDFFKVYYPMLGNHDTNYQGVDDGDIPKQLSNQTITNLMFRDFGRNYYTFKTQVSRFYIFDSGTDWASAMTEYRWEQVDWFAKQLSENDDAHSVIGIHIVTNQTKASWEESPSIQPFADNLTLIARAYNGRQTITLNEVTYDFTNATGKVEFVISGHTHWDGMGVVNSIPTMFTTLVMSGYVPTFDLIYADYTNRVVKAIRVGNGENRTMSLV